MAARPTELRLAVPPKHPDFREWYARDPSLASSFDPARKAYEDAKIFFSSKLTQDQCKQIWLDDKNGMQACYDAVLTAKEIYEGKQRAKKARRWLASFALRVKYYGGILDVLSQHHPEYVALAWGTVKFLFVAVVNHEEVIAKMAQVLSQIGDTLPQAELKAVLFPTEHMLALVSRIYALLIKFLQQALAWYKEGKLMHFLHSITKPVEITFKDLLEEIAESSRSIDRLAVSLSQAEQRDMHLRLIRVEENIKSNHTDLQDRFTEVQMSQTLSFCSSSVLPQPEETLRYNQDLRKRHRLHSNALNYISSRFNKLHAWASSNSSSILICQGTVRSRHEIRHLALDIIELLRQSSIPVVWALDKTTTSSEHKATSVDILKSLILQVLMLSPQARRLDASQFQSAVTEAHWLRLLRVVLTGLQRIYIVIDLEVLGSNHGTETSWLLPFFQLLTGRDQDPRMPVMKVLFVNLKQIQSVDSASKAALEEITIHFTRGQRAGNVIKHPRPPPRGRGKQTQRLRSIIRA